MLDSKSLRLYESEAQEAEQLLDVIDIRSAQVIHTHGKSGDKIVFQILFGNNLRSVCNLRTSDLKFLGLLKVLGSFGTSA